MDYSTIYWITRLDALHSFLTFAVAITISLFFLAMFSYIFAVIDGLKEIAICSKRVFIFSCVLLPTLAIAYVLTPTTKEMAMIYIVPNVYNSQVVQKDIPEIYNLGINYLKEKLEIKETKNEK